MAAQTKKRQAKSHTGQDEISIHVAQKHSFEHPLYFNVRVLVTWGGHRREWTMDMLPGMQAPIQLDHDQQLILIAHDQDLLVDSRGMERAFFYPGTRRSTQRDPKHWVSRRTGAKT